jgi:hypothetical protein
MHLATEALPTLVAAASAAAAVASFLAYVYFARRSEAHAARDEALALAETRGQVIADLRARVGELEAALRATQGSLVELLLEVQADLEREPPNIERALAQIGRLLDRPAA